MMIICWNYNQIMTVSILKLTSIACPIVSDFISTLFMWYFKVLYLNAKRIRSNWTKNLFKLKINYTFEPWNRPSNCNRRRRCTPSKIKLDFLHWYPSKQADRRNLSLSLFLMWFKNSIHEISKRKEKEKEQFSQPKATSPIYRKHYK
jgi:hypothetical protein